MKDNTIFWNLFEKGNADSVTEEVNHFNIWNEIIDEQTNLKKWLEEHLQHIRQLNSTYTASGFPDKIIHA